MCRFVYKNNSNIINQYTKYLQDVQKQTAYGKSQSNIGPAPIDKTISKVHTEDNIQESNALKFNKLLFS